MPASTSAKGHPARSDHHGRRPSLPCDIAVRSHRGPVPIQVRGLLRAAAPCRSWMSWWTISGLWNGCGPLNCRMRRLSSWKEPKNSPRPRPRPPSTREELRNRAGERDGAVLSLVSAGHGMTIMPALSLLEVPDSVEIPAWDHIAEEAVRAGRSGGTSLPIVACRRRIRTCGTRFRSGSESAIGVFVLAGAAALAGQKRPAGRLILLAAASARPSAHASLRHRSRMEPL